MKPLIKPATPASLAQEIRSSEAMFIEAATKAIRQMMEREYPRMRGYAIEAGANECVLHFSLKCGFNPDERFIEVQSRPEFQPPVRTSQQAKW